MARLAPGRTASASSAAARRCTSRTVTIQGFAQQGIDFAPSSTVDLFVRDTIISNNQGGGIVVAPSGAAGARVSLSNVRLDQNGAFGLSVDQGERSLRGDHGRRYKCREERDRAACERRQRVHPSERLDSRSQLDGSPNSDRRKNQFVREQYDLPQQRRRRADAAPFL